MEKPADYVYLTEANERQELESLCKNLNSKKIKFRIEVDQSFYDESTLPQVRMGDLRVWVEAGKYEDALQELDELGMLVHPADETVRDFFRDFSNEELEEVLIKPEEWGEEQVKTARWMLSERGREIDVEKIKADREEHLEEMYQPRDAGLPLVILMALALLPGGVIGLLLSFWVGFMKGTDHEGEKYYLYTWSSRRTARIFALIGTGWLVYLILANVMGFNPLGSFFKF